MKYNVQTVLDWAHQQLLGKELYFGHGIDSAWDEAVQLILHVMQLPEDSGDEVLEQPVTREQWEAIKQLTFKRCQERVPLSYLLNKAWFMGLPFYVDERVLIPRSPFAEWIEKHFQPWVEPQNVKRILEIGTGSACMAIAAAKMFPHALVDAVDIDADALEVAKINVRQHDVAERLTLHQGDCFEPVQEQRYDVIMTNPPYVPRDEMQTLPAEYHHEPQQALEAERQGLAIIERILQQAAQHLTPKGILMGEVGNSMTTLQEAYPELPFIWLEQERGGHGLFVLERAVLESFNP